MVDNDVIASNGLPLCELYLWELYVGDISAARIKKTKNMCSLFVRMRV